MSGRIINPGRQAPNPQYLADRFLLESKSSILYLNHSHSWLLGSHILPVHHSSWVTYAKELNASSVIAKDDRYCNNYSIERRKCYQVCCYSQFLLSNPTSFFSTQPSLSHYCLFVLLQLISYPTLTKAHYRAVSQMIFDPVILTFSELLSLLISAPFKFIFYGSIKRAF